MTWINHLFEELAFERVGGTQAELRAGEIISQALQDMGLKPTVHEFPIKKAALNKAELLIDGQKQQCTPYEHTGSGQVSGPPVFLPDPGNITQDVSAKIPVVSGPIRGKHYAALKQAGALGIISVRSPRKELAGPLLAQEAAEAFGPMPGVMVDYEVGLMLERADSVAISKTEQTQEVLSRNIVVVIEGQVPEEVVFTAHYDSVPGSPGVLDNLGGTLALLSVAKHLSQEPGFRTARLIWCGSEERGLLGSKAYAKGLEHPEKVEWLVNIDVLGGALGRDFCRVIAGSDGVDFVKHTAAELTNPVKVEQGIYSSDSMPFALLGIPSFNLGCESPAGHFGHTSKDDAQNFSWKSFERSVELALAIARKLLNSRPFPLHRSIPKDILEEVKDYFELRTGQRPQ